MLWLLPLDVGPVRVRLDPGAYVVPRWYEDMELGALVEVLRRVLEPAVMHAAILPVDALGTEAWVNSSPGGSVLIAVRGELDGERREELGRWAREHRHHMLVRARADEDELSTGWLERWIKPAVVWLLERGAWAEGHPLDAFGIDGLEPDRVARATEDPVEVLWLAERMFGHRLRYAKHGIGEQDYARSLRHAVGERSAERLRRYEEGTTAALDVIVGGMQSKDGWAALVGAGLGVWREGVLERGPLLRMVEKDWAAVEVIVERLGEGELSTEAKETMKARRRSAEAQLPTETLALRADDAASVFDGGLLAAALRAGLMLFDDMPMLLSEAVEAIERWEEMRWSRDRIEKLKELRLRLHGIRDMPSAAHRWMVKVASQVLAIITAENPIEARHTREKLRRLLSAPLTGWELDVWLNATLESVRHHRNQAREKEDLERAAEQLREVIEVAESHGRPWHAAEARRHLAELAFLDSGYDIALSSLRDDVVPAFERLGDIRSKAFAMGQIAAILFARGDLEEALHTVRHYELPVYERLGDARLRAAAMGRIADILEAGGDLEQALHIRRHDELPAYEGLGDDRSRAITMGKIAAILQAQGDLEQALHIRQHVELPTYERLGDIRSKAITLGEIADIHQAKGDLDQALRIRRDEELPILERLGDTHLSAITRVAIAFLRLKLGNPTERADITRLLFSAYRDLDRLSLPIAPMVLELARQYGIDLDPARPQNDPSTPLE